MTIGLPRALLYYRFGGLWEAFFRSLGCDVLISEQTNGAILADGIKATVDESCLPLKIFMGHVQWLIGRCDYIFVPRMAMCGRGDEYCVRFRGLPDLVRSTYPQASILSCKLDGICGGSIADYIGIGNALGKGSLRGVRAYRAAAATQRQLEQQAHMRQSRQLRRPGPRVLVASQPYLALDDYLSGSLLRLLEKLGGRPVYSCCLDRGGCRNLSEEISGDLYWLMNKEILGAIAGYREQVDGIILLTAFPCGSDSLVNELVMRRVKGLPMIQILLDEHQATEGLETRMECFMDILAQRSVHGQAADN